MANDPSLPTYREAANVLEKQKGSGVRLLGWTFARTIMIAPAYMILTPLTAKQAFLGAFGASCMISMFTLLRVYDGRTSGLGAVKRDLCRAPTRARTALSGTRARRRAA